MTQRLRTLFRSTIAATVALVALAMASEARAGTATSNVTVSATVVANCTISNSGLAFGNYDPISANASTALDATGTLTVACTNGSATTITLGQGSNADTGSTASAPLRRMLNGASNYLSYTLFRDSARSLTWGGDATVDLDYTGTGSSEAVTIYGRVAAGQNKPAGAYSDTVVATITF